MKNSALVVIDRQTDITKNYREIMEKVNEAIDWAVKIIWRTASHYDRLL